ncbi:MAG: helix-turn-helix domain-containing protein [Oscillospiraceae bacterium]|nr:helix-turn-helix domain-containing protein [Oscillospiraceae bacterium]
MKEQYIRDRITELRLQKGVSEYKMSLDLGHSKSYIQSISSGKSLPSMPEFLYICEYLGVTPKDFFDDSHTNPALVNQIDKLLLQMEKDDLNAILCIAARLVAIRNS